VAITRDQALGSNHNNGVTATVTTGAIVAAGSRIVVCVSLFATGFTSLTVSDSGGSYTQDKLVTNGSDRFLIFSRVLVGSLASGQVITPTFTGSGLGGFLITACSYLGTTALDTTTSNTTTGTGFSSGSASNSIADALFVGGAGNETATTSVGGTNTNGTSRFDIWDSGAQQGMRMLDQIAASVGAQALTGTWASTSTAATGALAIYKGTAATTAAQPFVPGRMPLGA
jgi:hypothetical protein